MSLSMGKVFNDFVKDHKKVFKFAIKMFKPSQKKKTVNNAKSQSKSNEVVCNIGKTNNNKKNNSWNNNKTQPTQSSYFINNRKKR